LHFNQEARAKPLEHIIFILDSTVSQNIDRFVLKFIIRLLENMGHSGRFLAEQILKDEESSGPKKRLFFVVSCLRKILSFVWKLH
jgi:hypothetical protein